MVVGLVTTLKAGSVSLPITTAIGIDQGRLNPGDKVAILGIGNGLVCLMLGLDW